MATHAIAVSRPRAPEDGIRYLTKFVAKMKGINWRPTDWQFVKGYCDREGWVVEFDWDNGMQVKGILINKAIYIAADHD